MTTERDPIARLIDDYRARRINRRTFFQHAATVGLSLSAAGQVLAANSTALAAAPATAAGVRAGGVLQEGYDRDVSVLDPVATPWWDATLYPATHETLIATDPNGKFVPMLAASWAVSSDALTWTFKIRPNLTFQSGAPCDAHAVAACMNIFRNPSGGSPNWGFWTPVTSVVATDATTVVAKLSHPYADFPFVLNNGYSAIFNPAKHKALGSKYGQKGVDGTGPFTLAEFVPGSHCTVKRWGKYPGSIVPFFQNKGKPYLDGVVWQVLLEPATRAQEIEAGNVDALHGPAPQDVARLKSNPNLVVIERQEPSLYLLGLNFQKTSLGFDDVRVRQAVSHAIDRQAIAEKIFFGLASPSYTLVPSAWPYYEPSVAQYGTFDPTLSKKLLAQAGWTGSGIRTKNGKKLSFSIYVEQDKTEQLIAQAVQAMLLNIGIDMHFTALDPATYFTKVALKPDGYMIKNLWTNMFDASLLFAQSTYFPPNCCDYSLAKIPVLDAALNAWQHAASEAQLKAAARQAQLIAAQQLPFIAIVTPTNVWVHHKKVHGWMPTQSNLYPFYQDVWLES